jgi:hypothetical protein
MALTPFFLRPSAHAVPSLFRLSHDARWRGGSGVADSDDQHIRQHEEDGARRNEDSSTHALRMNGSVQGRKRWSDRL